MALWFGSKKKGGSFINGGPKRGRQGPYMPALAAIRCYVDRKRSRPARPTRSATKLIGQILKAGRDRAPILFGLRIRCLIRPMFIGAENESGGQATFARSGQIPVMRGH